MIIEAMHCFSDTPYLKLKKGHTNKNAHKLSRLTDVLLGICPNSSCTFATDKVVEKGDI